MQDVDNVNDFTQKRGDVKSLKYAPTVGCQKIFVYVKPLQKKKKKLK